MPELQQQTRTREESTGADRPAAEPDATGVGFEVAGADVTVSGDPSDAEAAALAAVLAEHLRAEAEADAEEEPRYAVDPWCLAGRLGRRSRAGLPAACPSGCEWKVAGRGTTW